jgi:hypothetical protein
MGVFIVIPAEREARELESSSARLMTVPDRGFAAPEMTR